LLSALAAAISLAAIALPLAQYAEDDPAATGHDTTAAVIQRQSDLPVPATVALGWGAASRVRFGAGASGVVTAVWAQPGTVVRCGASVVEVDGSPVLALCGARPLWRAVDGSTPGPDRDEVVALLQGLHHLPSRQVRFTAPQIADGIRKLQKALRKPPTGVLGPADTLWIGAPITPAQLAVSIGDVASAGRDVLTVAPVLLSAQVTPDSPQDAAQGPGTKPAQAHVVHLQGSAQRFPIGPRGSVTSLQSFADAVRQTVRAGDPLPATVKATLRLATPVTTAAVPPAALLSGTGGTGGTCVMVAEGSARKVVKVQVVDSTLDAVLVTGDLPSGAQVWLSGQAHSTC
jgi:hypothetical protein